MRVLTVGAVLACWFVGGCTVRERRLAASGGAPLPALTRADVEIGAPVTGEACTTESCFLVFCGRHAEVEREHLGVGYVTGADSLAEWAERIATYRALRAAPQADALIFPRTEIATVSTNTLGLIRTHRACARVRGKPMRVKLDSEVAQPSGSGG